MSHKKLALALSLIVAASPAFAQSAEPTRMTAAPAAGPNARYCLRVAAVTGRLAETVQCWTREQWAEEGVDIDKAWAKEGVSVRE